MACQTCKTLLERVNILEQAHKALDTRFNESHGDLLKLSKVIDDQQDWLDAFMEEDMIVWAPRDPDKLN